MHDELRKQKATTKRSDQLLCTGICNGSEQRLAFTIDETMMIDRMSRIRIFDNVFACASCKVAHKCLRE
jgi:hypothetical protein